MERVHELVAKAAEDQPEALAFVNHDDRRITWGGFQAAVEDARAVLAGMGVGPGERVVVAFENAIEVAAFYFAASHLDAAAVMVNARLTAPELDRIIAHSDPSAVVFSVDSSEAAQAHAEAFGATECAGQYGRVAIWARAGSTPEPVEASGAAQVALLLYTSGTTGHPKAAMLTHANMIAAARASAEVRGMRAGDVTYLALPMSHIFGLVTVHAICLAQGAARLEARFDVARLYAALQEDVTLLPAVPQMHAHLFHYARAHDMPRYDRGLLRYVSSGGAPLDPVWKREAEAFYGLPLQNG